MFAADFCAGAPPVVWDLRAKQLIAHLELVATGEEGWSCLWSCPATGRLWVEDYPRSQEQGGGPLRLRNVDGPPDWASSG